MSQLLVDAGVILILIAGIAQFRAPRGARLGNLTAAFALLAAVVVVLQRHGVMNVPLILAAGGAGAAVGWLIAVRVSMIGIPAMVAFQHGAGGIAALLVSVVELTRVAGGPLPPIGELSALLGLVIGAATFSGSMIASGKLANRLRQTPMVLPRHNAVLVCLLAMVLLLAVGAGAVESRSALIGCVAALTATAIVLGVVFSIRIGGADMPVLISFLNATAGLAAAFCGVVIENRLLIACGATVAASGSILTHVMCRGMNRGLASVFAGIRPTAMQPAIPVAPGLSDDAGQSDTGPESPAVEPVIGEESDADPMTHAAAVLKEARRIIIIPGYGMALADAQSEVVQLAEQLVRQGRDVRFAIHPVAGRMPGHMHVLLAEAEVDYGLIHELNDINPDFPQTDVALVVGACDVVNPAAIEAANTPISGMPILQAHEARHVIVCNLDERPGYSGVANPLYGYPKTILLLGDAKETIARLRQGLE